MGLTDKYVDADEVYPELSPMGKAAVDYIRHGLAVIPLRERGKEPLSDHGIKDWTVNADAAADYWLRNPTANVGIVTGDPSHGVVAVDMDRHGETDGLTTVNEWETANGVHLPETVTFETGSGGRHMLYRVTGNCPNSANSAMAVDVRGNGGYIVAPPSVHPNGEPYEELVGIDDVPIADADAAVRDFLAYVRPQGGGGGGRFSKFELPDTIPQGDRDDTLYRYACSLRARYMEEGEILAVLRSVNDRCRPPMKDAALVKIAASCCRNPAGPSAEVLAFKRKDGIDAVHVHVGVEGGQEQPPTRADAMKDETSDKILGEMLRFPAIVEGLKTNRTDGRLYVLNDCIGQAEFEAAHPITDGERALLFAYFERAVGVRNKSKFMSALDSFAALKTQQFDPIKDSVTELEHVGEGMPPVRGTILHTYLGAEDTPYVREAETLMFRQLVARSLHPGCKADIMVIFVGEQGTGKSTFVGQLALRTDFYLEGLSSFGEEDIKRLAGRTVVEIPELDSFGRADINTIKRVITTRTDTYRKAYARDDVDHPRTAVFFGTTNDMEFLTDTTGNRRFLIVECHQAKNCPHPGIFDGRAADDIRQAYAETYREYLRMGEREFMRSLVLPADTAKQAMEVQEAHSIEDPVQMMVEAYMDGLTEDVRVVNVKMVMVEALGYEKRDISRESKYRLADIAKAIDGCDGWERSQSKQTRVPQYGCSKSAWIRTQG